MEIGTCRVGLACERRRPRAYGGRCAVDIKIGWLRRQWHAGDHAAKLLVCAAARELVDGCSITAAIALGRVAMIGKKSARTRRVVLSSHCPSCPMWRAASRTPHACAQNASMGAFSTRRQPRPRV
jgi:hypothetical protein